MIANDKIDILQIATLFRNLIHILVVMVLALPFLFILRFICCCSSCLRSVTADANLLYYLLFLRRRWPCPLEASEIRMHSCNIWPKYQAIQLSPLIMDSASKFLFKMFDKHWAWKKILICSRNRRNMIALCADYYVWAAMFVTICRILPNNNNY